MSRPHSLFGVLGKLCFETGWTPDYVLNRLNVIRLSLMTADAPHYVAPGKAGLETILKRYGRNKNAGGVDAMTFFTKLAKKR